MYKIRDKDFFTYMKGIAIVLMIIHHSFGYPEWYIDGISYPSFSSIVPFLQGESKICVPIFVFLTGGGYWIRNNSTFKYSAKKIGICYLDYWIVFILCLLIAVVCGNTLSAKSILLEAVGVENILMKFCWYMPFYAVIMVILPLYSKVIRERRLYVDVIFTLAIIIVLKILDKISSGFDSINLIGHLFVYFPTLAAGYLVFKYDLFTELEAITERLHSWVRIAFGIICVVVALTLHGLFPYIKMISTGAVLVPLMLLGFYMIQFKKDIYIKKTFVTVGRYSMNIWFLHCIFFSDYTKSVLMPIAYFPRVPILVVLWILVLCLVCAIPISKAQAKVRKVLIRSWQ